MNEAERCQPFTWASHRGAICGMAPPASRAPDGVPLPARRAADRWTPDRPPHASRRRDRLSCAKRFCLIACLGSGTVSCASGAGGTLTPTLLAQRVQAFRVASGESPDAGDEDRFHLGFPTASTVSLWHLGKSSPSKGAFLLVEAGTGATVSSEPTLSDARGRVASGSSAPFGATRLTFGGLAADTEYVATRASDGSEILKLRTAPLDVSPE
jgi:hypothetical protein